MSEERLPLSFKIDIVGGPDYATEILERKGGLEDRNIIRPQPRRTWEFAYMRNLAEMKALYNFFLSKKGSGIRFRMRDPFDYIVTNTEGYLGTLGVGTGEPTYQASKHYISTTDTHDEDIFKLISGYFTGYRGVSTLTVGASPGNISIDYNTGITTFVADATSSITSHTPGSDHVFVTSGNLSTLAALDKIYLRNVTGTAASILNNIAHPIVSRSGTGPVTWTISTDTTGLTATTGNADAYPQADENLRWAGQFDRPVRFMKDGFKWRYVTVRGVDESQQAIIELSDVGVIELLEAMG